MDGDCGHGWGYHYDGAGGPCYKCEEQMGRKVVVEQDPEQPVETKVLAQAIVDIGKAARALATGGLNQKAVVVLVAHDAKLPQRQVKTVLESLQHLAKTYTTR